MLATAVALALVNCVSCAAPAGAPHETLASTPLRPLFQALEALQTGATTDPVAILQLGDSHTANDAFSGRMRTLMQARFGNAGRGMLPPGIPFRLYNPAQVTVTAKGWQTIGSLAAANPGPFGLSGVRQTAIGPAEMTLRADQPDGFDSVSIEAIGQPGGGTIDVTTGSGPLRSLRTDAPDITPLWLSVPTSPASLTLRTRGNGPVAIASWTTHSIHPGITWSNLGTIGATIDTFGRFDPALMAAELQRLRPVLILVAFGTNEGFKDSTDPAEYAARYAARLRALHAAAPAAAILVIGPPDGTRHGPGDACPRSADAAPDDDQWTIPPRLPEVRDAQRRVAEAEGFYFWDWSAAMGGPCSIRTWARTNPPMAAADHIHLLTPGYRATADKLFEEIMRQYDVYRAKAHAG
jgi:lysophospholipase L1-like esterase